jgi:hypothetical protein
MDILQAFYFECDNISDGCVDINRMWSPCLMLNIHPEMSTYFLFSCDLDERKSVALIYRWAKVAKGKTLVFNNIKFLWLGQFIHCHTTYVHHICAKHWPWRIRLSWACITLTLTSVCLIYVKSVLFGPFLNLLFYFTSTFSNSITVSNYLKFQWFRF